MAAVALVEEMIYEIESGVPIPTHSSKNPEPKWRKMPFLNLKPGQSFFVPADDASFQSASLIAANATKATGTRFTTRKCYSIATGNFSGTRVWRTAD